MSKKPVVNCRQTTAFTNRELMEQVTAGFAFVDVGSDESGLFRAGCCVTPSCMKLVQVPVKFVVC